MKKYDYLKRFINNSDFSRPFNYFESVDINKIISEEKRLGFLFPQVLKEFWLEIGWGRINVSKSKREKFDAPNTILSPEEVVDITLWTDNAMAVGEIEDFLQNGLISGKDVVFFEVADSSNFLVLKPESEYPEGVYSMYGPLIEPKFEDFIWKLYHISPTYYF